MIFYVIYLPIRNDILQFCYKPSKYLPVVNPPGWTYWEWPPLFSPDAGWLPWTSWTPSAPVHCSTSPDPQSYTCRCYVHVWLPRYWRGRQGGRNESPWSPWYVQRLLLLWRHPLPWISEYRKCYNKLIFKHISFTECPNSVKIYANSILILKKSTCFYYTDLFWLLETHVILMERPGYFRIIELMLLLLMPWLLVSPGYQQPKYGQWTICMSLIFHGGGFRIHEQFHCNRRIGNANIYLCFLTSINQMNDWIT